MNKIDTAKKTLEKAGYDVQSIWHIEFVKSRFGCSNKDAKSILSEALSSRLTKQYVATAIEREAGRLGHYPKQEQHD